MSALLPDFHSVPYSTRVEDEIMELLWEDRRPVVQTQSPARTRAAITAGGGEFREGVPRRHHRLFVEEDEMASWLQYPFGDFVSDRPCSPTPCVTSSEDGASEGSPLVPKAAMGELSPSVSNELTAAERHGTTPLASSGGVIGHMTRERARGAAVDAPPGGGGGGVGEEGVARDETMVTSPPVGSTPTGMGRLAPTGAASQLGMQREKRKREGREAGDGEWLSDEKNARFESANAKKGVAKSTPAKRSHRANARNPSERRRRDRVSRKMKGLQELIPQRAKADRSSLPDEAIEYLKSLQLQVQMMSMGCGMVPVAFPGVQACMPCMNMGTATDAGTNRPVMLFPNISASSMMQPSTNGAHFGPGVPMTIFRMQQQAPNQYRTTLPNHLDPALSSQMIQNPSRQFPANASSFQQQLGLQYMQQPPQ